MPVQIFVVDKSRFETMHFRPVPHEHKAQTAEEKLAVLDVTIFNLAVAREANKVAFTLWRMGQKEK